MVLKAEEMMGNDRKLRSVIAYNNRLLEPFRENRRKFLKEIVGHNYSDSAAQKRRPINPMQQAFDIYWSALSGGTPKSFVTTKYDSLIRATKHLESGINNWIIDTRFDRTVRQYVADALVSVGITKTALEPVGSVEINGVLHDTGAPYVDRVSLDDLVMDMTARRWDQLQFIGNKYSVPLELLRSSDRFDSTKTKQMTPDDPMERDEQGIERTDTLSRGEESEAESLEPIVWLYDIYYPQRGEIQTLAVNPIDADGTDVIGVFPWEGPEEGPYHMLSFTEIPDQVMPLSPAATWYDLHRQIAILANKLGEDAENQKRNALIPAAKDDEARRIRDAQNGEAIPIGQGFTYQELASRGADPGVFAYMLQQITEFDRQSGNLTALGGLGTQADTLGQEQLLTASASRRVSKMADDVTRFTANRLKDVGYYLWTDPVAPLERSVPIPGPVPFSINTKMNPEERPEESFYKFNVEVNATSMERKTPDTELRKLMLLAERFAIPFEAGLQSQGASIDYEKLVRRAAELMDLNIGEIIVSQNPDTSQPGPSTSSPARKRTDNFRHQVGNDSPQSQRAALMTKLLGTLSGQSTGAVGAT